MEKLTKIVVAMLMTLVSIWGQLCISCGVNFVPFCAQFRVSLELVWGQCGVSLGSGWGSFFRKCGCRFGISLGHSLCNCSIGSEWFGCSLDVVWG